MGKIWFMLISACGLAGTICAARAEPLEFPSKHPKCERKSNATVIDVSYPTQKLFERIGNRPLLTVWREDYKIDTIFRYYDNVPKPSIPGKPMRKDESDALIKAGFKIGVVFQHNNNNADKFREPNVGRTDAKIALDLAEENKQPYGTAIYFGLDGPFPASTPKKLFVNYFNDVEAEFQEYAKAHAGNRYDIGMYCSYDVCGVGDQLKLKYMWLSPSGRNDAGYRKRLYRQSQTINLLQSRETFCDPTWIGVPQKAPPHETEDQPSSFDFDQVNKANPNLGTWDHKRD